MTALEAYEDELREHLEKELTALPGVQLWSRAASRTPTLLLTFDDASKGQVMSYPSPLLPQPSPHGFTPSIPPSRHRMPAPARQVHEQLETVIQFVDIHSRPPGRGGRGAVGVGHLAECSVDFIVQLGHEAPGLIAGQ